MAYGYHAESRRSRVRYRRGALKNYEDQAIAAEARGDKKTARLFRSSAKALRSTFAEDLRKERAEIREKNKTRRHNAARDKRLDRQFKEERARAEKLIKLKTAPGKATKASTKVNAKKQAKKGKSSGGGRSH